MPVSYFVRMRAVEGKEQMVQDVLLSNVQRIRAGERGNLAFAVHRSRQDPREFWLYETWADLAAVEEHESGAGFKAYKEELRPLVESDSVLFGEAEPLAVLGYPFPGGGEAQ
ncbi:MAG TPA: putative quinol monooxygenase [Streptosporangiaceae bacterium]|nr:putative quinol monooxygenase [Streptosporangiaceae bacterium]